MKPAPLKNNCKLWKDNEGTLRNPYRRPLPIGNYYHEGDVKAAVMMLMEQYPLGYPDEYIYSSAHIRGKIKEAFPDLFGGEKDEATNIR